MSVRWGAAARPKHGQQISGDAYVVVEQDGWFLTAMIDGLGGGAEAAHAADAAVAAVRNLAHRPLKEIMEQSHRQLHGTRGAVMGLLRLEVATRKATFVGVGNIGVHVLSSRSIKPISRNGILGHRQLPSLLEMSYTYDAGDVFILYSDGISTRFISSQHQGHVEDPEGLAHTIMTQFGKPIDDATVVVVVTEEQA